MSRQFNMRSLILSTGTTIILPLLLLFSLFLLLRGHDEPGGGFIGGLVAAAAIALKLFADDYPSAKSLLRVHPLQIVGVGTPLRPCRPYLRYLLAITFLPRSGGVSIYPFLVL
ncbi:hypothetical protein ALON55S_05325 [Alishewanella longhuensis]